jgi:hypothetical protein
VVVMVVNAGSMNVNRISLILRSSRDAFVQELVTQIDQEVEQ